MPTLSTGSPPAAIEPLPQGLVDEIQAGNCVAFLGAGFSAAADVPGWSELLLRLAGQERVTPEMAAHVRQCVEVGTAHALDEAAQLIEDEVGRSTLLREMAELMARPAVTPRMEQRLRWIRGIPFRVILTTNFDGVLAGELPDREAYRSVLRPSRHRWWETRYWRGEGKGAFTVKLHGDLSRGGPPEREVVLTRRDYRRRLYTDAAYVSFLRTVLATTTVLYLGFSFEDAYLNELRSEILALLGHQQKSAPVAYAIVNDVPEPTRRHYLRHEGVHVLSYDSRGHTDYSAFDRYLEAIHAATNPILRFGRYLATRRILWLDPHPENNQEAFEFLGRAVKAADRDYALVTVAEPEQALARLAEAAEHDPFDLVITHWGAGDSSGSKPHPLSNAERLLTEMRRRDLRAPVIVFGWDEDLANRRRIALGLGAQEYCSTFESLFQRIESVLAPA